MTALKLLVVEDNAEDMATCRASVTAYQDKNKCKIEMVENTSVDDAFRTLDTSFDGAIIDLKLDKEPDGGNRVTKRIAESNLRIPIAIFTATPASADMGFSYIGIFMKGETSYETMLDKIWGIHNTGLTRIMGGRGILELTLGHVFQQNILPRKDAWISHGKTDSLRTERALLRHTLDCLMQLLDADDDKYYAEEFYIYPPINAKLKTGSIVKKRAGDSFCVVLNPACDLVIRKEGAFKTDRILLGEIDTHDILKEKKSSAAALIRNTHSQYHHWLPPTDYFPGGFLNFRKLGSHAAKTFADDYYEPVIQISPSFVKDLVARFSSFYARQGQPDIDSEHIIASLT